MTDSFYYVVFFNDTATTEIYTLSLHDALPISLELARQARLLPGRPREQHARRRQRLLHAIRHLAEQLLALGRELLARSEEHTSELQSRQYLVCRLLLEKKKKYKITMNTQ